MAGIKTQMSSLAVLILSLLDFMSKNYVVTHGEPYVNYVYHNKNIFNFLGPEYSGIVLNISMGVMFFFLTFNIIFFALLEEKNLIGTTMFRLSGVLLLAGLLGNGIELITVGKVVDFIYVGIYLNNNPYGAITNLADIYMVLSVFVLFLALTTVVKFRETTPVLTPKNEEK